MQNRIKDIRNALGCSQAKFARELGFKQSTVATWELGSNVPENARNLICRTFKVRRTWLEDGEGEMFESAEAVREVEEQENFVRECFESLTPEQKKVVMSTLRALVDALSPDKEEEATTDEASHA